MSCDIPPPLFFSLNITSIKFHMAFLEMRRAMSCVRISYFIFMVHLTDYQQSQGQRPAKITISQCKCNCHHYCALPLKRMVCVNENKKQAMFLQHWLVNEVVLNTDSKSIVFCSLAAHIYR